MRLATSLLATLLVGCNASHGDLLSPKDTSDTDDTDDTEVVPPEPSVALTAREAFDPIEGVALVDVEAVGTGTLAVIVEDEAGSDVLVWTEEIEDEGTLALEWDGRDAEGELLPAGVYHLVAELQEDSEYGPVLVASAEQELVSVRAAFDGVLAEDDEGATATRVDLYWHEDGVLQDRDALLSWVDVVDEDGLGLDLPAIDDELEREPGGAQPVAYTWDSLPILSLTVGEGTELVETGLDLVEVGVRADGWQVLSGVPLSPGEPVVLQKLDPLAEGPGVVEDPLELEFTLADDTVIGDQLVPLRMYAVLDTPGFDQGGDRYQPWPAAIDPALRAIEGVPPDEAAVLDALVDWIFSDLGLTYDTEYGASAYTAYGWDWTSANFYMSDFLDRRWGSVVNCSDCAGILGAYANMVGGRQSYLIILEDFDLNQILAVGGEDFTNCPFGGSRCGFRYHAVTTNDGGGRIWDATLALDGDDAPGDYPGVLMPVHGVSGDEYLERLVMSGSAEFTNESQGNMQ